MRSARLRLAAAALLLALPACTAWQSQTTAGLSSRPVERARVTLSDGSTIVLAQPRVQHDSIVGYANAEGEPFRLAFAAAEVRGIETRGVSHLAQVGSGLAASTVLALMASTLIILLLLNRLS